jgi:hypothetical protein
VHLYDDRAKAVAMVSANAIAILIGTLYGWLLLLSSEWMMLE